MELSAWQSRLDEAWAKGQVDPWVPLDNSQRSPGKLVQLSTLHSQPSRMYLAGAKDMKTAWPQSPFSPRQLDSNSTLPTQAPLSFTNTFLRAHQL